MIFILFIALWLGRKFAMEITEGLIKNQKKKSKITKIYYVPT